MLESELSTIDTDRLVDYLDRVIRSVGGSFRQFCSRSLKNQLYFQNVQFVHNVPQVGSQYEENVSPDEWVQANFYQAILTMKHALLSELNPVPVVRAASPKTNIANLLTTRQAIEVILRESDFDNLINVELWNLLLFGMSTRIVYTEAREKIEPSVCLHCQIPLVRNECALCGDKYPGVEDRAIKTLVVAPYSTFFFPETASRIEDVAVMGWTEVLDRATALSRLAIFGLTGEEAAQAIDSELGLETTEVWRSWALPRLREIITVVRKVCRGMSAIGQPPQSNPPGVVQGRSTDLTTAVTHIFIRKGAIPDLSECDLTLHFIGENFFAATTHSLDDHVSVFRHRVVPGRFIADSEESVRDQQDAINNLLTLSYISAMTRSFSIISVDARRVDPNSIPKFPNSLVVEVDSPIPEVPVRNLVDVVPGTPITPDVPALRDTFITNMQILGQTFPVLFGQLPPGVEAYKAIEVLRSQSLRAMRPFLQSWYSSHFRWVRQAVALARRSWKSLRASSLDGVTFFVDPDTIDADVALYIEPSNITPTGEQDRRALLLQGVGSGLIDISNPSNKLRVLSELGLEQFEAELSQELDVQKQEINKMIETGEFEPVNLIDNHQVHYFVVRGFLRSPYGRMLRERKPDLYLRIEIHGKIHMYLAAGQYESAAAEMAKMGIIKWMEEGREGAEEIISKLEREIEAAQSIDRSARETAASSYQAMLASLTSQPASAAATPPTTPATKPKRQRQTTEPPPAPPPLI